MPCRHMIEFLMHLSFFLMSKDDPSHYLSLGQWSSPFQPYWKTLCLKEKIRCHSTKKNVASAIRSHNKQINKKKIAWCNEWYVVFFVVHSIFEKRCFFFSIIFIMIFLFSSYFALLLMQLMSALETTTKNGKKSAIQCLIKHFEIVYSVMANIKHHRPPYHIITNNI